MRCRGCNMALSDGEMCAKNKHTGEYEDLCASCRSPMLDGGIIYDTTEGAVVNSTPKVLAMYNETDFEKEYVGGVHSGLSDVHDILAHVAENGSISMEEL